MPGLEPPIIQLVAQLYTPELSRLLVYGRSMDLRVVVCECVDRIQRAQQSVQWRVLMKTILNLGVL
jgi:hypothetical protein